MKKKLLQLVIATVLCQSPAWGQEIDYTDSGPDEQIHILLSGKGSKRGKKRTARRWSALDQQSPGSFEISLTGSHTRYLAVSSLMEQRRRYRDLCHKNRQVSEVSLVFCKEYETARDNYHQQVERISEFITLRKLSGLVSKSRILNHALFTLERSLDESIVPLDTTFWAQAREEISLQVATLQKLSSHTDQRNFINQVPFLLFRDYQSYQDAAKMIFLAGEQLLASLNMYHRELIQAEKSNKDLEQLL